MIPMHMCAVFACALREYMYEELKASQNEVKTVQGKLSSCENAVMRAEAGECCQCLGVAFVEGLAHTCPEI